MAACHDLDLEGSGLGLEGSDLVVGWVKILDISGRLKEPADRHWKTTVRKKKTTKRKVNNKQYLFHVTCIMSLYLINVAKRDVNCK